MGEMQDSFSRRKKGQGILWSYSFWVWGRGGDAGMASNDWGLSHLPFEIVLISGENERNIHFCTDSPLK